VAFTVRGDLIRLISARDMNRNKEPSMRNMKRRAIPEFRSEDDERKFWATADSTKYLDWSSAKRRKLVHIKLTLKTISLRLPVSMIEDLKVLANQRDVPYQSLLKVYLAERLTRERHGHSGRIVDRPET
jgi:hypothetical protein